MPALAPHFVEGPEGIERIAVIAAFQYALRMGANRLENLGTGTTLGKRMLIFLIKGKNPYNGSRSGIKLEQI